MKFLCFEISLRKRTIAKISRFRIHSRAEDVQIVRYANKFWAIEYLINKTKEVIPVLKHDKVEVVNIDEQYHPNTDNKGVNDYREVTLKLYIYDKRRNC